MHADFSFWALDAVADSFGYSTERPIIPGGLVAAVLQPSHGSLSGFPFKLSVFG